MQRAALESDAYASRIVKLFPWEASACMLFSKTMITDPNNYWISAVVFVLLLLSSILYNYSFLKSSITQNIIMNFSFIFWTIMITKDQIATILYWNDYESYSSYFESNIPYVLVAIYVAVTALVFPKEIKIIRQLLKPKPHLDNGGGEH